MKIIFCELDNTFAYCRCMERLYDYADKKFVYVCTLEPDREKKCKYAKLEEFNKEVDNG